MKYNLDYCIENFRKTGMIFFWSATPKRQHTDYTHMLSNWSLDPIIDKKRNITFKTAEHAVMYKKAELFDDEREMRNILICDTAKQAKARGRAVRYFDGNIWDENSDRIYKEVCFLKAQSYPKFRDWLIATEDKIIVEASPYDRIWGVGLRETDKAINDPYNWLGANKLGFVWMEVRDEIKRG